MKKLFLLFSLGVLVSDVNAQSYDSLALTGTTYTQNFTNLSSGRPTGWHVFTEASATALGRTWDTSATKLLTTPSATGTGRTNWNGTSGNFRNVASGNTSGTCALDSVAQLAATDRALGIRLIGPSTTNIFGASDSSAAFGFKMANTAHKGGFALSFKLQSLDPSSPRINTWVVDYGIGNNPSTFTTVTTTGTMTTGNSSCTNNTITANFGTSIDSLAGPVWIRIRSSVPSTGSGNRSTVGIDDFTLTFVNHDPASVKSVAANSAFDLYVAGNATNGNLSVGSTITETGKYTVAIYDMTGRIVYTQNVALTAGKQTLNLNDANLSSGLYMIKLSNGTQAGVVKASIQ